MSRFLHSAFRSTLEPKDPSEAGRQPSAESRLGSVANCVRRISRRVLGAATLAALLSAAAPVSATTGRAGIVVTMETVTIIGQRGLSQMEVEDLHSLLMMIDVGIMVSITMFYDLSANELVSVVAPTPLWKPKIVSSGVSDDLARGN